MKKLIIFTLTIFTFFYTDLKAQQSEGTIMLSGAGDIIKTDIPGVIQRYQAGVEGNYFLRYFFSLSAGYEFNYLNPNQVSLGGRFYIVDPLFVRVRGLIGSQSDVAVGLGYSRNITYRLRFEGMFDYYTVTQEAGLRAGISILLN